jgi:hypothetical protein
MADTKISDLTAVTTPAGTDEFAVNQGGTSKKMTLNQIQGFSFTGGDYAPGSFTVADGSYALMVKQLQLTGSQRATLAGTARLRID